MCPQILSEHLLRKAICKHRAGAQGCTQSTGISGGHGAGAVPRRGGPACPSSLGQNSSTSAPRQLQKLLLLTFTEALQSGDGVLRFFLDIYFSFPLQTLILITGKRLQEKAPAARGRGARPWRWQSGPGGQGPPSAGTGQTPSSEGTAGWTPAPGGDWHLPHTTAGHCRRTKMSLQSSSLWRTEGTGCP